MLINQRIDQVAELLDLAIWSYKSYRMAFEKRLALQICRWRDVDEMPTAVVTWSGSGPERA